MADITNLKAFGEGQLLRLLAGEEGRFELPFDVSREEFDKWRSDKEEEIEEIGGFEYNSSLERIVIKADGGPLHGATVSALAFWLYDLVTEDPKFSANLGEGNLPPTSLT